MATKEDTQLWSDLAATITRKIGVAQTTLDMMEDPRFVIHMSSDGKHTGAVLQVISETPANTSVNFAGDPETVKVFESTYDAHQFMKRFHLAYAVGPLETYLKHYIVTHNETVAMLHNATKG